MKGTGKSIFKCIFSDVSLLYKNFFHWNISKILYLLYGLILGIITLIPFALSYFIYVKVGGGVFSDYINSILYFVMLADWVGNLIYIISMIACVISFYFSYVLLIRLNNSYIDGKRIEYFSNDFFNFRLIGKYWILTLLFGVLVFVLPIIAFILIFSLVVYFVGGVESALTLSLSATPNGFIFFTLFLTLALVLMIFNLFYRFIFAYYILANQKDFKKVSSIGMIKESFKSTKGFKKLFQFIKVFFVILLMYMPFYIVFTSIETTYEDLNTYAKYINLTEEQKETLKSVNTYTYERLEATYSSISLEQLSILQNRYYILSIIFSILKFICINGVFMMVLNSVYKRIIKD